MAPLDVTTAEAQVASSQQDLVVSETTLEEEQVTLKNLISRTGLADPVIANAEIIPLDRIDVPEQETLPSFKDALATAMTNRADLGSEPAELDQHEDIHLGHQQRCAAASGSFWDRQTARSFGPGSFRVHTD